MSDDDRPKKSWREKDLARDRSGGKVQPRRDPEERSRAKIDNSPAYKKYVSQLDNLFKPGGQELPDSLKAKLGPPSAESQKKQTLLADLNNKSDAASLAAYLDAGLELPEDARLMVKLLDVSDTKLLPLVLRILLKIVEGGQKPSRMLLIQKLDAIILKLGSGEAVELAQQIRAEL